MNLKIGDNLSWDKIDNELIIFKLDTGSYYRLNNTGGFIFSQLSAGMPLTQVIEEMDRTYDQDMAVMTKDADDFVQQLLLEGLLVKNE